MRKKELLATGIKTLGAWPLVRGVRHLSGAELVVLAYHRVLDVGEESQYEFDPELVSASPEEFEWQMRFVRDNFDVLSFKDVGDHVQGRARLPRRPLVVTFDDGFDDNYHHAFRILKNVGIAATFFISTGYIGTDRIFWFDWLAHLLMRAPPGTVRIPELPAALPASSDVAARRAATNQLLAKIKTLSERRRSEILLELEALGREFGIRTASAASRPMTWEQVIEMHRGGMEIGSHTVSHPILSTMEPDALRFELTQSKAEIESRLNVPVRVIGYPVGTSDAFNAEVVASVRAAGYELGCSYVPGTNPLRDLDRFRLRRQHIERYTSRVYFEALLSLPSLMS
ncbi:MAG TPA: polysaccharide deacetylase family protein [Steroidobacteraceae bacterium]|nr:polysaccharide deacetylase family protein [Steroidobacteraceae bacterium]